MGGGSGGEHYGGFWRRLGAVLIDAAVVFYALSAALALASHLGLYVPRELAFLLVAIAYATILVGRRGSTLGKALLGMSVRTRAGQRPGYLRTLLRESLGKLVSAVFLALGFLWVGLSRRKRGWHDLLAGTLVVRTRPPWGRARLMSALLLSSVLLPLAARWGSVLWRVYDASPLTRAASMASRTEPGQGPVRDVKTLSPGDDASFARWLDAHGQDPRDYAVETASRHQVTIFGERHRVREDLGFLNHIIPALYHRANVTCLAMECCVAEDNAKLAKLVTSAEFDGDLAAEIARDEGWAAWGYQEYWDVLFHVWQLNRSLPAGAKRLRVVGIDSRWDGPSFALAGFGDVRTPAPAWERLRIFRVLDDLPLVAERDAIMARAIEREAFLRGDRTVVWVGFAHSLTTYRVHGWTRMASLLYRKYGDRVFQIRLHDSEGFTPGIAQALERAMVLRHNAPVGFDVDQSPVGLVRERLSLPGPPEEAAFSQLAQGYLFLKPLAQRTLCGWQEGYVSPRMLASNRPYYEAVTGRRLRSSTEANQALADRDW